MSTPVFFFFKISEELQKSLLRVSYITFSCYSVLKTYIVDMTIWEKSAEILTEPKTKNRLL